MNDKVKESDIKFISPAEGEALDYLLKELSYGFVNWIEEVLKAHLVMVKLKDSTTAELALCVELSEPVNEYFITSIENLLADILDCNVLFFFCEHFSEKKINELYHICPPFYTN
ncbi:MAG: hypothetical protein HRT89_10535 [Lentisphaeria bacterium]|nr:hypothetical protein [Lentisphaeria bacterium]NQZ68493.1 hypothetical protein [Lentisphaeria bacterium]